MPLKTRARRSGTIPAVTVLVVLATLDSVGARNGAQSRNPSPTFEVASIKRQRQDPPANGLFAALARYPYVTFKGGRFSAGNMTAAGLILEAYGRQYRHRDQIQGGPGWLDQEEFQIEALAPVVDSPPSGSAIPEPVIAMLRNLLETRFKLRVTREMRERPVYALVRARKDRLGAGIRASRDDCPSMQARLGEAGFRKECIPQIRSGGIKMVGQPMEEFLRLLTVRVGRLIINETGLTGNVDVDLAWEVQPPPRGAPPGNFVALNSAIFAAVQDDLGLKLESRVTPVPVLVIEHLERPSEN